MKRLCEDCDEEIPSERLAVKPHATLCLSCQTDAEREGRFTRHRMGTDIQFKGDEVENMETYVVRGNE